MPLNHILFLWAEESELNSYFYMMNSNDEKLVAFFKGRKLPLKGYFQISTWDSTFDLKNTVDLAIVGLRAGDSASREMLQRIKQKLEAVNTPD